MKIRRFSMIELMTVTAVIAIVASILLPALTQARNKARQTGCLNNLKQIGLGLSMYSEQSDGWGMGVFTCTASSLINTPGGRVQLGNLVTAEILSVPPESLFCPTSKFAPGWKAPRWEATDTAAENWTDNVDTHISYDVNPRMGALGAGVCAPNQYREKLDRIFPALPLVSDWHGVKDSTCPRNHGDNLYLFLRADASAGEFRDTGKVIYFAVSPLKGQPFTAITRFNLFPM